MSLETTIGGSEAAIRSAVLFGTLVAMAVWEHLAPLRPLATRRGTRWCNHLALAAVNVALGRVLFPWAGVGLAAFAVELGIGLFNIAPTMPVLAFVASLLALDFAVYLLHLLFHAVPALWRVHRVHHADVDVDISTGVRFHPLQMIAATLVKFGVILAVGAPVLAVLAFEAASHAITVFNHANIRISPAVDRVLRRMIVTPDMHRIHHSVAVTETDSNFGFVLPWWDRLFGTYCENPAAGQARVVVGLEAFRSRRDAWLDRLLINPLCGDGRTAPRWPKNSSG